MAATPRASGCNPMAPGGKRGTYWRGGPPPREGQWRAARTPLPPPAVAEPALGCGLRAPTRDACGTHAGGRPRLRIGPSPPAAAPWEGPGGDGHLRWLVGRLRTTSWMQACMARAGGKGRFWHVVASHFFGRTPDECQGRWRFLCGGGAAAAEESPGA